jgi:leukotriene-A4 hydrolase
MKQILLTFIITTLLFSCTNKEEKDNAKPLVNMEKEPINDPHSYADFKKARTTHLFLNLEADFENKVLKGIAAHDIENNNASEIIFDTKGLNIEKVITDDKGSEVKFSLSEEDPILGKALTVSITPKTSRVEIYYSTNPSSEAVQWLSPQQTAYKKFPFMFTQGEAILTRSWIPIQDSPGNKITYEAAINVPDSLTAVMSAKATKHNDHDFYFIMEQPIPCYLIALAIGKLEYASLGKRSGVYAEPNMLEKSVYEFKDVEKMIEAADDLYGEYAWEQYDIIVLPPSFPFGGMENPRLTFVTPTIISGDRSLTSLIAHELAHSWSGNLATNSTWDDFWLNEGFTVYFERRITEKLYGKDYSDMLALLGYQDLVSTIADLDSADTHLKLNLEGRNPDDGMTEIAYEKGYFMLRMIEENIGRDKFDAFLKQYFTDFKFSNLTTEQFLVYISEKLPKTKDLNLGDWIYGPGIPKTCLKVSSANFDRVDEKLKAKANLDSASIQNMKKWTTHEWLHYLRRIDSTWTIGELSIVDNAFGFTNSGNSEIAAAWFENSIEANYRKVYPKLKEFLVRVGRRKFLTPLYKALLKSGNKNTALNIYKKARPNYHFIATNTMDELLGYSPQ